MIFVLVEAVLEVLQTFLLPALLDHEVQFEDDVVADGFLQLALLADAADLGGRRLTRSDLSSNLMLMLAISLPLSSEPRIRRRSRGRRGAASYFIN
jgi:hypothetical protein